jgi:glycerophosphoryl diester phosphodiesterase
MKWIKDRPIAHRGLHKGFDIPENSISAFKRAINSNYAIELDVRFTKDEKIVVFHDKNLIRLCADRRKIRNQNYSAIKNIKLYNTNETIPLLSDVLALVNGKVPLVIEIKNYEKVGLFEELIAKELENYTGEFAICSFNHHVVDWFSKNKPDISRGLIFGDIKKFNIKFFKSTFLYRFFKVKPDFISLDYKLINTLIPVFCRRTDIPIVSWTVDSKKKRRKAIRIVDNIVFENIKPKKI